MVAKDASCGSETYRPYLDIERIINVQSAGSVNRGHDHYYSYAYAVSSENVMVQQLRQEHNKKVFLTCFLS